MDTAKRCPEDFVFHRIIGEGSFSMVYLARDVQTKYLCAVKVCEKSHIHREKMRKAIFREKQIMKYLTEKQSKFIIKLLSTFQDDTRLYFVLNYCVNGELLSFINQREIFDQQATLFYAGEILVALEHLHRLDIVHRDLKPENILLNEKMHIQITDFGSAFFLNDPTGEKNDPFETTKYSYHRSRKNTFVGTAQYVSPEMLSNKKITGMCDIWAWACMLFQMIAATPPFSGGNEYSIFQKIQNLDYKFNEQFPDDAKELIKLILKIDPQDRLGSTDDVNDVENGYKSIRNHRFFQSLNNDWNFLNKKPPEKLLSVARNEQSLDELCAEFDQMNLTTGLNEKQMTRLLCLSLHQESDSFKSSSSSSSATAAANNCDNKNNQQQHQQQQQQRKHIMDISKSEFDERIRRQKETNKFHQFVENNLIIKQGLIDKKKGLIPRRRMFLLTTGPHLYYVDPANMILKGEVPFGKDMRTEAKNFRNFYIHVPNRTYILEDITNNAPGWCEIIDNVNKYALQQQDQQQQSTNKTTDNCTNDRQLQHQQNNGCNNQSNQNNTNNSLNNSNNSINNNNNPSNTNTTNNSNVKKSRNSIFNLNIKKITSSSSSSSSSSSNSSSSNTSNTNQSSSSANHSLLNQQQHHQQQQQSNNNNNNNSNTSSSSSIAANNNN